MGFKEGNSHGSKSHGGGRPRNEERDALRAVIDANVSPDAVAAAFKRIEGVLMNGGPGWLTFFKEYMDRRYGKPDTYQALDITTGGEPLKGYMVVSPDDWPDE
jgi:hypothetical protein